MGGKVLEKALGVIVVLAVLISVGFLYIRYIIQHDYEILYLTEEERDVFWQQMAEEEGAPSEEQLQTEVPAPEEPDQNMATTTANVEVEGDSIPAEELPTSSEEEIPL